MGRQKTVFHFSEYSIKLLKDFANNRATQKTMIKMFKNPELAELIESENTIATTILNTIATTILNNICENLKITGKPDMRFIKDEYKYYESLERINPEYNNWRADNGK